MVHLDFSILTSSSTQPTLLTPTPILRFFFVLYTFITIRQLYILLISLPVTVYCIIYTILFNFYFAEMHSTLSRSPCITITDDLAVFRI